ncbi:hypothetical protein XU18_0110 [Perkinsela sp. CCAP 1560/4]|nr:hypothetical protein XU18_0110 [Perkinsela sp. CCAP 1560/4]|eukprot:KNH09425.1 hypothetical protein XU18_0110 [Perkinsela sp. CCAP 1560/4]
MDVYEQAGRIVHSCLTFKGSAKSLCLKKEIQKKKQTYAIVCSTLCHIKIIDAVIESLQILEQISEHIHQRNKNYFKSLIRVFAYECIFGKGLKVNSGPARFLESKRTAMKKNYENLKNLVEFRQESMPNSEADSNVNVRVNYLKEKRNPSYFTSTLPGTIDPIFPDLFNTPSASLSSRHSLVKKGNLILQNRPSCLPAHCICEAMDSFWNVVDACASPGNKTTHICALHKWKVESKGAHADKRLRVMAIEKDTDRFNTLRERISVLGASDFVTCLHGDFLQFQWSQADVILCDPTCSANRDCSSERFVNLARFQIRLLLHALLDFPAARCVSYSTCTLNQIENELVVSMALEIASSHGWNLHHALPDWPHRGVHLDSSISPECYEKCYPRDKRETMPDISTAPVQFNEQSAVHCLRNPEPYPFFVAIFKRELSEASI